MRVKSTIFFLVIFLCVSIHVAAQRSNTSACSVLGQTPETAFPVCANDTYTQSTVPICTNSDILVAGCTGDGAQYQDKNPFWYRFTCYQGGSLGFLITPNSLADDYDWQMFDITNVTNLSLVYTSASLFVVGNWSGSSGVTGASASGKNSIACASSQADNISTFSLMPTLIQGHTYLLMISHYSDNQSGYNLSFGGGTAVITDPSLPDLKTVKTSCDASTITLKLNKKVKCNSLAADGSDFTISPALATVVGAIGANCSSSFDMDSVTLTLSNGLPPGSYELIIKKGDDVNTLLDDCNRDIPEGHQLPFVISVLQPTLPDSITPPLCAPRSLQLVFKKNIHCSSIAANGSDFTITGPAPVAVSAAAGTCNSNDLTSTITLTFTSPVVTGGVYQVKLASGTDGNVVIDECGQETPAGSGVTFTVKDTVSAAFTYQLLPGCLADTVVFVHDGSHGVNQWQWIFDAAGMGTAQSQAIIFRTFGDKKISLKVSNGFCSDSTTHIVTLDNALKAAFETNALLCPEDAASFKNSSTGNNIISYNWIFGDGSTSAVETPPGKNYPVAGIEKNYLVQLIVQNQANCFDTAFGVIKVLKSCYIAVPNAFTPNGDGLNDYLYPLNAFKADNLEFNVYNRLGQMVFHTSDWTQKWDGKISGQPQSSGVFVWILRYTDHDSGKKIFLKGSSLLIR